MTFKPLVVIPCYNTGPALLLETVQGAVATAGTVPVWVVVDGSTDGSEDALEGLASANRSVRIIRKEVNSGKGDSLRLAAIEAEAAGFSHLLAMDADGQHPPEAIVRLLEAADRNPGALIMGQPEFGADAPFMRRHGRKLTLFWTNLETLWCGLGDSLFGMRVYPVAQFNQAFRQTSFARGFDFDPEIAVRMAWLGCRPVQVRVRVRYLSIQEGGVSHFNYLRDNAKLTLLHFRLIPELLLIRLIPLLLHRCKWTRAR